MTQRPETCTNGIAAEGSFGVDGIRRDVTFWLCGWADTGAGIRALTGAPPWMQRHAIAGHLMNAGDCLRCPAYQEKANG